MTIDSGKIFEIWTEPGLLGILQQIGVVASAGKWSVRITALRVARRRRSLSILFIFLYNLVSSKNRSFRAAIAAFSSRLSSGIPAEFVPFLRFKTLKGFQAAHNGQFTELNRSHHLAFPAWHRASIPRYGIPRLLPGEECGAVPREAALLRKPPASAGGASLFGRSI